MKDSQNRTRGRKARPAVTQAEVQRTICEAGKARQGPDGDWQPLLITTAADIGCTGITQSTLSRIDKHRGRLRLLYTVPLGEGAATIAHADFSPADATAQIAETNAAPRETIKGARYSAVEILDLRIAVREDLGLTQGIFQALDRQRIYPRTCRFLTSALPWTELGWPEREGDPTFRSMANIAMQIEVPSGIGLDAQQIIEQIRGSAPREDWHIRCGQARRPEPNRLTPAMAR